MVSIRVKCSRRFQFFRQWFESLVKLQRQYRNMLLAWHQYLWHIYHLGIAKIDILICCTYAFLSTYQPQNLSLNIWYTYFFALITTDTNNTVKPDISFVLSFESKHLDFESNFIVFTICIDDNRWVSWTAVLNGKFRIFQKCIILG